VVQFSILGSCLTIMKGCIQTLSARTATSIFRSSFHVTPKIMRAHCPLRHRLCMIHCHMYTYYTLGAGLCDWRRFCVPQRRLGLHLWSNDCPGSFLWNWRVYFARIGEVRVACAFPVCSSRACFPNEIVCTIH